MALTLVGRYQIGFQPYMPVQDPNDSDSIYFVGNDGSGIKLKKFTWPDIVVDVSATLTGLGAVYRQAAIMDGNFSTVWGYLDTDRRYAFMSYPGTGWGNGVWTEINLEDGTVTQTSDNWGDWGVPYGNVGIVRVGYDGTGSFFYSLVPQWNISTKRPGTTGTALSVGAGGSGAVYKSPVLEEDGQTYIEHNSSSGWFRRSINGTPTTGVVAISASYLPASLPGCAAAASYVRTAIGSLPLRAVAWTDGWRYLFARGTLDASGGYVLYLYRKNVNTGQYSEALINTSATTGGQVVEAALDIWEANGLRKLFFAISNDTTPRVYSTEWPPVLTDYVDCDTSGNCIGLHTNQEFIYGVIVSGGVYSHQIVKLQDADLIVTTASPSISAPGAVLLWKDKRLFYSGVTGYLRYLWWSAPYEPQALDPGWDGYNTTVFDDENVKALISLEDSVYIGSQKGWVRLRGKSPDHWVLDKTLGDTGPISNKSVAVTPFGAIYPREDGLRVFNAYSTRFFAEQVNPILAGANWDEIDKAFSLWDGRYFRFFYPKGSATANDRELIVDLIAGIGNERVTEGDRAASAGWYDFPTQTMYLGTEGGVIAIKGTSGSRNFLATSKEFPAANLMDAGAFSTLHYDIDNKGIPVVITPIYDGAEQATVSIPAYNGRKRGRISLPKGNAYRVGIKVSVTTNLDVRLYEPWFLE